MQLNGIAGDFCNYARLSFFNLSAHTTVATTITTHTLAPKLSLSSKNYWKIIDGMGEVWRRKIRSTIAKVG